MPAKYHVIIRRAPTGFVYLHQSRISNRAQCSIARCSPRGERSSRSLNIEFYCFKKGSILSVKISQFYSIRAIVKIVRFRGWSSVKRFNSGRHLGRGGGQKRRVRAELVSASAFTTYRPSRPPTAPSYP